MAGSLLTSAGYQRRRASPFYGVAVLRARCENEDIMLSRGARMKARPSLRDAAWRPDCPSSCFGRKRPVDGDSFLALFANGVVRVYSWLQRLATFCFFPGFTRSA